MINWYERGDPILHIVAGILLGSVVGLLLGLSASPAVASVLAAVVSGVIVFLSLGGERKDIAAPTRIQLARIICFCIFLAAGAFSGLLLRVNSVLGRSELGQQYEDLRSIGVSEAEARSAVIARFKSPPDEAAPGVSTPVLFDELRGNCPDLEPNRFASKQSLETAYKNAGAPWAQLYTAANALGVADHTSAVLSSFHDAVCGASP
ncbi:hypothetical protein [Ensifer aridi]|uniref:hypothetical protein n=1 Tax=Ensifer aridi TaxID=1708715 RepID=UPI000A0FFB15|nr:hypothetical protein [Ensifer aridi]